MLPFFTAKAEPLSNLEVMDMFNSISPLKHPYQLEIRVNDDLLGAEKLVIGKDGTIRSRYAGKLKAAGYSSKQLAIRIRNIILSSREPSPLQLPKSVRVDPLVRVVVTGVLRYTQAPATLEQVDRHSIIKRHEIFMLRPLKLVTNRKGRNEADPNAACLDPGLMEELFTSIDGLSYYEASVRLRAKLREMGVKDAEALNALIYPMPITEPPPQSFSNSLGCSCQYETVMVIGNVGWPHRYLTNPDMTISQIVRLAGGFTRTPLPVVRICRVTPKGEKFIEVHAKAVWLDKNPDYNLFIRPRDVIIVE